MSATDAMIYKVTSMNLSDISILNIKGADYQCIISGISKSEAINSILPKKVSKMKSIITYKNG